MSSIKEQIIKALQAATGIKEVNLEFPEREEFGDYSTNIAMILAKKRGNFLENVGWILKNVTKDNWEESFNNHPGLPVGKLSKEVKKAVEAISDLVFLKPRIYAKTQGWWRNFPGHKELSFEFLMLPLTIANPLEVFEDPGDKSRFFLTFDYQHRGVLVVEVNEKKEGNQIVTMFLVGKNRFKRRDKLYLAKKDSLLGRRRISSLLAPRKSGVAGAGLSGLQESYIFYSKLEKESQGEFSLEYQDLRNPKEIAQEIVKKILGYRVEVAGQGFINFWLKKETLLENLQEILVKGGKYGSSDAGKGKTIVIDYSSPNIAKHFSIGHLRSTIIGQAIYNLYKFLGYKVIGDNHLGDWGTQFGMIIAQVVRKNLDPKKLTVDDFQNLYVEFNKEMENNPELKKLGQEWFKKLEEGDAKAKSIWKDTVKVSLREFSRIYKILNVSIDEALGESFYKDKTQDVIDEIREKGLSRRSKGAEIVEFNPPAGGMPPAILIKSDRATTYFTRDLATLKYRIQTWDPALIIYEVGSEQTLYFRQVFAAARLLGWKDGREFVHVGHGLFRFSGKKMSTRKGTDIKLEEILEEAIARAAKINPEVAEEVGIGAVKYLDLRHHPTSDIDFDWDKAFVLQGNSGPYLQYTVARTNSVLAKIRNPKSEILNKSKIQNSKFELNSEELLILRVLVHFPEVVADAAAAYSPNLICNYLYDLASKFNTFYNRHRILGSEKEKFRLALTATAGSVLKTGLGLLGIEAPERM